MPTDNRAQQLRELARRFIGRSEALSLKATRRDDAAVNYFVGAAVGAELAGDTALSQIIGANASAIVAARGFEGVQQIARSGSL